MQAARILVAVIGLVVCAPTASWAASGVARSDFGVTTRDGVHIFVREFRPQGAVPHTEPLILLHGARVPGLASFDLPVPGGSLAGDLADQTARVVYVMDARGYGGSDRSPALDRPASESPPQSRAYEVIRDVDAVVAEAKHRTDSPTVALLGWATGGMWAAYYASLHPEQVGHLVTLNALYGGSDRHAQLGPGSPVSDPTHPDRLNPAIGAYALFTASSLLPSWDRSIPLHDKAAWRDPAIAAAYQQAALASDPQSDNYAPPAFRAPTGATEDSFYQASGRRLFDASSITSSTLVVRSEHDFWSRPEDALAFAHDATHAALVRLVTLPSATHYAHLDRAEHGRAQLLAEVTAFLINHRPE